MPGVLQAEHHLYAEELRLLGARSGALIQHLMEQRMPSSFARKGTLEGAGAGAAWEAGVACSLALAKVRAAGGGPVESTGSLPGSVGLRSILERCLGLLIRVADGRAIEVSYGDAASVPVTVSEETVERILVNLVSNSAAAMRGPGGRGGDRKGGAAQGTVLQKREDRTADEDSGSIRIEVGAMINRVQDPRPWPLRRVRLTVEDSGCGMAAEEMERILSATRAPSRGDRFPGGARSGCRIGRRPARDECAGNRYASADRMAGERDGAGEGRRYELCVARGDGFKPVGRILRISGPGAARSAHDRGSGCGGCGYGPPN
jgi:hypothetical protein